MKTTNASDRVARDKLMDKFCASRNMFYEPINDWSPIDAKLYNKGDKMVGLAKVKSFQSNYGTNPSVSIDKQLVDFLHELGLLCGVKIALLAKFRDKLKYVRLEDIDKLPTTEIKRGKATKTERLFPIGLFQDA